MRTRSKAIALSLSLAIAASNAAPASGTSEQSATAGKAIPTVAPRDAASSDISKQPVRTDDGA